MVQKKSDAAPKRRGRPRAYDPQAALQRATDSFWKTGYAGTSLDEISAATGMNRPSLYAAFGDKRALYLEALAQYWQLAFSAMREAFAEDLPLKEALTRVYEGALSIYFSGDGRPRGCFVIGTAVIEAVDDLDIRNSLGAGFRTFDTDFETRFRTAIEQGELKRDADPAALALLATATMHTIAIRARAGSPRADLTELARKAVGVICG
ncbi:MAG TPA: TetR/AcrR family transcriptional regulator [Aliidongia sp.]|uniref:TetR/AcrR family transcriptional regulator n=1 Tax=Aliidongia sp. TaxID=1914230 RepID=UPI002DDCD0D8|nr:TetR/AcrR family transcriptional regulator [Aliidongia sp.]HEV2674734.1 TetR/AcrR family transcriptional regulator [Aliidongia sp.]